MKPVPIELPVDQEAFMADPHPVYDALRSASGGVAWVTFPNKVKAWLVLDYELGKAALTDPRLSRLSTFADESFHRGSARRRPLFEHLLTMDPPAHTRLRALVQQSFVKKRLDSLIPFIEGTCEELIDGFCQKHETDFVPAFAEPLPLKVICHILGTPVDDIDRFRRWSKILTSPAPHEVAMVPEAGAELREYLLNLAEQRPNFGSLFGDLAALWKSGALDEDQLVGMGFILLVAGHETTVGLIGSGLYRLLSHGGLWHRLVRKEMSAQDAVEELLRLESPLNTSLALFVRESLALGGATLTAGDTVYVALGACNRDPKAFRDRHIFHSGRDGADRHLAFGHGIHHCLGARLARLEGRIALEKLSERCPGIRLNADRPARWRVGGAIRTPDSLPVRLQ